MNGICVRSACTRFLRITAIPVLCLTLAGPAYCLELSQSRLPDAPQPAAASPASEASGTANATAVAGARPTQVVEPGEIVAPLTSREKLILSLRRSIEPTTIAPGLLSAGWTQLLNGHPKYGSDSAAFGERFGAAMLSSAITRALADGVFASAFHQDPRYYRVANGSIVHRGLLSAEQAVTRRSDSGVLQPNYSAFAGKLASAALALTYYPPPSQTLGVVAEKFATSIATGAGSNLVLEFFPDLARRVPFLRKFHID